jgi:hypothetical protein
VLGGIPGCEVTPEDGKTAKVIWGCSVLKMKGNTVRRNTKRLVQSVIKVPSKLIEIQQDVELAIDIFFINKHAFFTTYSTKICFTTVTHILSHHKEHILEALYLTYKMYKLRGFKIVVLSGDHEFAALSELAGNLLSAPNLNWQQHLNIVAILSKIPASLRRRFAPSGRVYPLNRYRVLWLSVSYCISLNL